MDRYIISTPNSRQRGRGHFSVPARGGEEAFAIVERHFGHPVDGLRLETVRRQAQPLPPA